MNPFTKKYHIVEPIGAPSNRNNWYRFFDIFGVKNEIADIYHRADYLCIFAEFVSLQITIDREYSRIFPQITKKIDYNKELLRRCHDTGATISTDIYYQHNMTCLGPDDNRLHKMEKLEYLSILADLSVYFLPVGRYSTMLSIIEHNDPLHGSPLKRILKIESF